MAQKSNIRSMRFSNEIIEMIESQAGETFTAKFENLVQRCMWELPYREKKLKYINEMISRRTKQLEDLTEKFYYYQKVFSSIERNLGLLETTIKVTIDKAKEP